MAPLPAGNVLREEVLQLERQRAAAMVREDIGALQELLAEDLSYTHSDGRRDTKESLLALIAGPSMRYLGIDYSDQEAIDCGDVGRCSRHGPNQAAAGIGRAARLPRALPRYLGPARRPLAVRGLAGDPRPLGIADFRLHISDWMYSTISICTLICNLI